MNKTEIQSLKTAQLWAITRKYAVGQDMNYWARNELRRRGYHI